jgi:hypothetical protein
MPIGRILLLGGVGAAVIAAAISFVSNVPSLFAQCTARFDVFSCSHDVFESTFPSEIPWYSHAASVKCAGAIAGSAMWPIGPMNACRAMHMCVNEAPLSDIQQKSLLDAIRKTPGCQDP